MKHKDLIKHWETQSNAARALNLPRQTVHTWKKAIPLKHQLEIERITNGELKADLPDFVRAA